MNLPCSLVLLPLIVTGLSACVTGTDRRADLKAAFRDQVRRCYTLPAEAAGQEDSILEVRLKPDGSLEQAPKVLQGSPDSAATKAAMRALKRCTPFQISPNMTGRYPDWKVMRIQFDTK